MATDPAASWSHDDGIAYEVAIEILDRLIGYAATRIDTEADLRAPHPDDDTPEEPRAETTTEATDEAGAGGRAAAGSADRPAAGTDSAPAGDVDRGAGPDWRQRQQQWAALRVSLTPADPAVARVLAEEGSLLRRLRAGDGTAQ